MTLSVNECELMYIGEKVLLRVLSPVLFIMIWGAGGGGWNLSADSAIEGLFKRL